MYNICTYGKPQLKYWIAILEDNLSRDFRYSIKCQISNNNNNNNNI